MPGPTLGDFDSSRFAKRILVLRITIFTGNSDLFGTKDV